MPRFEFRADPAWVTVSEGLSLGFRHWRATAPYWAIPVLIVGILSTIVYWGLEATIRGRVVTFVDPYDPMPVGLDIAAMLAPIIPGFIVSTLILGVVTLLTRWIYYALAISGLRGREISSGLVLGRGVRAFGADMLFLLAFAAIVALVFGIASTAGSGLAVILGIGAACVSLYLQVRLAFWTLMIFDGAGIVEAAGASWQATADVVGRMVGWAAAVVGVGFLVNIGVGIATFPLADAVPLSSGVKAGATEAFAVFQLFTLAVLYESQLRRTMPHRASPPPAGYAEPTRSWPGYAPVSSGYPGAPDSQAPGRPVPPWPSAPDAPSSSAPAATPQDATGVGPAWDEPPVNPDAPATWDPKPIDAAPGTEPGAEPEPPRPPAPPAI